MSRIILIYEIKTIGSKVKTYNNPKVLKTMVMPDGKIVVWIEQDSSGMKEEVVQFNMLSSAHEFTILYQLTYLDTIITTGVSGPEVRHVYYEIHPSIAG